MFFIESSYQFLGVSSHKTNRKAKWTENPMVSAAYLTSCHLSVKKPGNVILEIIIILCKIMWVTVGHSGTHDKILSTIAWNYLRLIIATSLEQNSVFLTAFFHYFSLLWEMQSTWIFCHLRPWNKRVQFQLMFLERYFSW